MFGTRRVGFSRRKIEHNQKYYAKILPIIFIGNSMFEQTFKNIDDILLKQS